MQSEGLFDLQVNGYAGVDFNDAALTAGRLDAALEAMLADGVTGCLPTLITASPDALEARFAALDAAVRGSRLGPLMVPGYHLEGPFLNAEPGYRGCHPADAMTDPDTRLVARIERGLSRPVLLVTLAPERPGSLEAIRRWTGEGKTVAVAHSAADFACIRSAAEAGLSLSTHLGNGLPPLLPKFTNTLLAQLAEPGLRACLIADGVHVPPMTLRALIALKSPERCILVTDAVGAAAMPPGTYPFAGMAVRLAEDGRVVRPSGDGLAGSALRLDQAVRNVVDWCGIAPARAVAMGGAHPRAALRALRGRGLSFDPGRLTWSDALEPSIAAMPSLSVAA